MFQLEMESILDTLKKVITRFMETSDRNLKAI